MKPREAGEGLSERRTPASFPPPLLAFSLSASFCLSSCPSSLHFKLPVSLPLGFVLSRVLSYPHPLSSLDFKEICLKRKWRF